MSLAVEDGDLDQDTETMHFNNTNNTIQIGGKNFC